MDLNQKSSEDLSENHYSGKLLIIVAILGACFGFIAMRLIRLTFAKNHPYGAQALSEIRVGGNIEM